MDEEDKQKDLDKKANQMEIKGELIRHAKKIHVL